MRTWEKTRTSVVAFTIGKRTYVVSRQSHVILVTCGTNAKLFDLKCQNTFSAPLKMAAGNGLGTRLGSLVQYTPPFAVTSSPCPLPFAILDNHSEIDCTII